MTQYFDQNGTEIPYDKVAESFTKKNIEFDRYKQDCRKRALELAEKSLCESRNNGTFDAGVSDKDGKILTKEAAEDVYLITLADRYYDWLISIP